MQVRYSPQATRFLPTSLLLFPTEQGKVEGHFLRLCKEYAKLSGQHGEKFWLHKFRDTFATWALRRGVDIRMVQHWLGHSSIEMTQRYLAPEQGEHAQRQINTAFGDFRKHYAFPLTLTGLQLDPRRAVRACESSSSGGDGTILGACTGTLR